MTIEQDLKNENINIKCGERRRQRETRKIGEICCKYLICWAIEFFTTPHTTDTSLPSPKQHIDELNWIVSHQFGILILLLYLSLSTNFECLQHFRFHMLELRSKHLLASNSFGFHNLYQFVLEKIPFESLVQRMEIGKYFHFLFSFTLVCSQAHTMSIVYDVVGKFIIIFVGEKIDLNPLRTQASSIFVHALALPWTTRHVIIFPDKAVIKL